MYAQAKAKRWQRKGGVARSGAELPSGQPAVALGGASNASSVAEPQRCCGKRSTNLTTKVLEGLFTSLTSLKSQISKQVSRRQMMFQALSNSRSFQLFQEWLRCPVSAVALITEVLGCCSNFLEVERRLAESLGGPRLLQPFLGPRLLQPSKQLR